MFYSSQKNINPRTISAVFTYCGQPIKFILWFKCSIFGKMGGAWRANRARQGPHRGGRAPADSRHTRPGDGGWAHWAASSSSQVIQSSPRSWGCFQQPTKRLMAGGKFMIELMQGDCLEVMKEIPDGSVDMVFGWSTVQYELKDKEG